MCGYSAVYFTSSIGWLPQRFPTRKKTKEKVAPSVSIVKYAEYANYLSKIHIASSVSIT